MLHSSCWVQQSFEGGIYWKLYFYLHYLIQGDAETLITTLTLYNLLKPVHIIISPVIKTEWFHSKVTEELFLPTIVSQSISSTGSLYAESLKVQLNPQSYDPETQI